MPPSPLLAALVRLCLALPLCAASHRPALASRVPPRDALATPPPLRLPMPPSCCVRTPRDTPVPPP
ncbi:hypothetical protein DENSPDRAFT_883191 [Dentipellis sp. KUC8613]|nr:hypothetical protein DENSPDRAFT_883191 [Dentipellis sp. KUC8613]